jgi:hypothetical protein
MTNKETATRKQKLTAFALGAFIVDIQTLVASYILMLMIGVLHHDLIPALLPAGFVPCILVIGLSQIMYVLMKFTIDFSNR